MNRCPRCNSPAADIIATQTVLGRETVKLRCVHCGRVWRRHVIRERYSFPSVCPCPLCAARGRVLSTQGGVRYMGCSAAACPRRWKVLGEKI